MKTSLALPALPTPASTPSRRLALLRTACAALALAASAAHAGLLVEATRIVYPEQETARTLTLSNTADWPVVVQTWFDDGAGDPNALPPPFIAVPAVFRLGAGEVQTLRILHTGEPLPSTQESVYWLNLYEIPPSPQQEGQAGSEAAPARLDLAVNTQLKLFYRPQSLPAPERLAEQLRFTLQEDRGQWFIVCHNPTAWHVSFAGLTIAGASGEPLAAAPEPDMMTPPYSEHRYRLPARPRLDAPVQFSLIDDVGFGQGYRASAALSAGPAREG